jgi:hypothetical protein
MTPRATIALPRSIRRELYPLAGAGIAAIALVVYELQLRGILLLLLAACIMALGTLVLIRPALGLAGVLACAAVVRIKVGTGTDSPLVASLVAAVGLLAAWSAHRALHGQPLLLLPRWVMRFGVLLACATIVSLMWGRITLDPRIEAPPNFIRVQIAAAGLVCVSVGLLYVGADLLRGRSARDALMITYIVIGFVALPFRLLSSAPPALNSAGLFGVWFVALCWGNALGNRRAPMWLRGLLAAGAFMWLGMAVFVEGDWVSGWIPAVVGFLSVTVFLRPRTGVLLVIACVVLVAAYNSVFYSMLVTQQESDGSLGGEFGRVQLWKRNLAVIEGRYYLGTGPAGYALYYVTFVPDKAMSTHSNYVDTLAQFGIPGVIGLLGLLSSLWISGIRALRRLTDERDQVACAVVLGGLPALGVAMWLGDWLIPFVYNQTIAGFDHSVYSWLMLAMLCGLIAQVHAQVHAQQAQESARA